MIGKWLGFLREHQKDNEVHIRGKPGRQLNRIRWFHHYYPRKNHDHPKHKRWEYLSGILIHAVVVIPILHTLFDVAPDMRPMDLNNEDHPASGGKVDSDIAFYHIHDCSEKNYRNLPQI